MSVHHTKGNLLDFKDWNVLAHQSNCQNTFGSGLAKQIREEFPAAYEADTEAYKEVGGDSSQLLGTFSAAEVAGGKRVVNLYGQDRYGRDKRHTDYEALYVALTRLKEALETAHAAGRTYTLGLPYKLGSGTGGGSWRVVEAMIQDLFADSPIKCYIVEYTPPVQLAKETPTT